MDGWRCDLKISPHVGLGGSTTIDLRISVDEGQVLALFGCEFFLTVAVINSVYESIFLIHQAIQPNGEPDEYTIPH